MPLPWRRHSPCRQAGAADDLRRSSPRPGGRSLTASARSAVASCRSWSAMKPRAEAAQPDRLPVHGEDRRHRRRPCRHELRLLLANKRPLLHRVRPQPGARRHAYARHPELPAEKDVLNAEIDILREMGVEFNAASRSAGTSLSSSCAQGYKGFHVAIGAQKLGQARIPGEELEGVYGGVDFLRAVNLGHETHIGKRLCRHRRRQRAMDVCRSAVRPGATRRTCFTAAAKPSCPPTQRRSKRRWKRACSSAS